MKHIRFFKQFIFFAMVMGFLLGLPEGCLEKDIYEPSTPSVQPVNPFGLFKIHLTLIDIDTKTPLPNLQVRLSNNTSSQMSDPAAKGQVTDSTGLVHVTIAAAPPMPQEFVLSFTDTTRTRSFQQQYISVFFIDPVFKYISKDAIIWGKRYQGTAEFSLTRELKQIYHE